VGIATRLLMLLLLERFYGPGLKKTNKKRLSTICVSFFYGPM
jgi:hypothetical protein